MFFCECLENPERFSPRLKAVLTRAEWKSSITELPPTLFKDVNSAFDVGLSLAKPFACYTVISKSQLVDIAIPQQFDQCETIALATVSIGKDIDLQISKLFSCNKVLDAVLLDAFSSEYCDTLASFIDTKIRKEMHEREGPFRFSPGYGDINLENNKHILNFLKSKAQEKYYEFLPTCNPVSFCMTPRKSIVFMMGFYKDSEVTK